MKKVVSVVGARPNFMKVAPIHRAFKQFFQVAKHYIVHTGQHYDFSMSEAFFKDLEMPEPDYYMGVGSASHAQQAAKVMVEFEKVCLDLKPDLVIVVGDVNSTFAAAFTAVKLGIKTAHVEGGLRSFDRTMPEEINRIATDAVCDFCFITEPSAMVNLRNENFPEQNIFAVGNTMIDSQRYAIEKADKSDILTRLNIKPKEFALITLHRPSNVDNAKNLKELFEGFQCLSGKRTVVFPIHPRTRKNLKEFGLDGFAKSINNLILLEPLGYIDFLSLMKNSDIVLTDSGGIQEETTALGVRCLTLRTTTERPVTVEMGTNILVNPEKSYIIKAIERAMENPVSGYKVPEFWDGFAGERIANIIINKILV